MPEPPLLLSFPYSNISMLRSHLADMYSTRLSAHRIDRTQLNSQPRQVSSYVRQSVSRWLAVWFLACDKAVGNIEKTFNLSPFSLAYPAPVILPFLHRIPGDHAIHLNFACISVVSSNPFPFPFSALSMLRDYIFILFLISLFPLIRGAVTIPILFLSSCMSFVFPWKAWGKRKRTWFIIRPTSRIGEDHI
ncbi:hypothetical protein P167DRAFT_406766 [Morchella conica CCBAS932]|uniref:Uncharacterized protein n=1 Tax=Morchella conica CCBAS932 TaxID=1392247 RepID=A0A3N4L244_9PEZI|nr:hypothetical protein P167DRAFT_406766 [Morchella conica CCBAS932]